MAKKRGTGIGLQHKGKESNKTQGSKADPKSKSDKGMRPDPRTLERGAGSEYANAVATVLDESRNLKGSSSSFLGEDKKIIDPKQFAHSLINKK